MKTKNKKVLFLDIETSPLEVYTWGMFDQNIGLNQVKKHTEVLSWSAKWRGKKTVMYADRRKGEKKMLQQLRDLMDEADIIVGHNVKRFDTKKIQYRLVVNNISRPAPFEQIDTLSIAKKYFGFDSNKLEHLSNILGVKHKKMTKREFDGFELWKECLNNNPRAWAEMKRYNQRDVVALEEVFNKLQSWASEVNLSQFANPGIICSCGSKHVQKHSFQTTKTGTYRRYRCMDCGSIFRDKHNLKSKEEKKNQLVKL